MEQETYPLILDGAPAGEVRVRREDGWTVYEVRSEPREGIVRVSVYGGGQEGYLGVLVPDGDGLALCRRMSRSALRGFPEHVEYAARAGQPCAAPEPPQAEPAVPEEQPETPPAPEESGTPPGIEDLYWYASPDGALICFDGTENWIALPAGDARIPEGRGGWAKTIEGRAYVVFRTRDGRLAL